MGHRNVASALQCVPLCYPCSRAGGCQCPDAPNLRPCKVRYVGTVFCWLGRTVLFLPAEGCPWLQLRRFEPVRSLLWHLSLPVTQLGRVLQGEEGFVVSFQSGVERVSNQSTC